MNQLVGLKFFFMNPQVTVCFAISMSCVIVSGQFFGSYDNAYRFGYDSNDFGGIGSFDQASGGAASIRDPRQNRGKVFNFFYVLVCVRFGSFSCLRTITSQLRDNEPRQRSDFFDVYNDVDSEHKNKTQL